MYQKRLNGSEEYVKHFFKVIYLHIVHPPPPFLMGGWVSYQIFKKGVWKDLNF